VAHAALIGLNSRLDPETKARDTLAGAGIDVARVMRDLDTRTTDIDAVLARNNDQATGVRLSRYAVVHRRQVPGAGILTVAQFRTGHRRRPHRRQSEEISAEASHAKRRPVGGDGRRIG